MSKTLGQKLLEVQKEVAPIVKDSDNPYYKSKYFDINKLLEVVKPTLTKYNLVVLQPLTHIAVGDRIVPAITTTLIDADSGDKITSTTPITEVSDAQKMGASVTYWRRYSLVSLLSLGAEDQDANELVTPPKGYDTKAKPAKAKEAAPKTVLDW